MLKSAVIKGLSLAQGRSLTLPFRDTGTTPTPYFIQDVSGLGPVKADINKSSYPDFDGDVYQSSNVGGRNPQFTVALKPRYNLGETVEGLRQALYRVVPPKTPVRVTLNFDTLPQMYVDGYVESVEPSIFKKNNDMVISIVSMDSYLASTTVVKNQGFPVNQTSALNYLGTAPTPLELSLTFIRPSSFARLRLNGVAMLGISYDFLADDVLYINTGQRSQNVYRSRNGTRAILLDNISSGSLDLVIDAATDTFKVDTSIGTVLPREKFSLTYTTRYVGA